MSEQVVEHGSRARAERRQKAGRAFDEGSIVDAASQGETFGINCSECGGSLRIHEGERSVRCEYCGSALFVTRPQGVRSFLMQPKITAGKARLSALHYLSSKTGGRIKARHASIVDLELIAAVAPNFFRVVAWYDNENSYSVRCVDLLAHMASKDAS